MTPNDEKQHRTVDRRSFLSKSAGVVAGATVIAGVTGHAVADSGDQASKSNEERAHRGDALYSPAEWAKPYGTMYPRVTRLEHDGSGRDTLLATWEHYESWGQPPEYDDKPYFPIYRSENGGQTWSKFSELRDTQSEWGLRYQPNLFELPTDVGPWEAGTVLAGVNSIPSDLSETSLELYASEDHGETWEYVSTIVTGGEARPAQDDPVWEPEFAISGDGDLVCYYSTEVEGYWTQRLAHKVSPDGGQTWESETIDVELEDRRPGMPVVQKLPNGSYMMAYEIVVPDGEVHVRTSPDGLDWGDPSDPGPRVETDDGRQLWNGPGIAWTPRGGPDGTVLVAAKTLRYDDGSQAPGSGRTLLATTDLSGEGEWKPISQPLWYDDEIDVEEQYPDAESAAGVGWTTDLVVSDNGKRLFYTTSTYDSDTDLCEIRYAEGPLKLNEL